jgi:hypothetical protein
MINNRNIFKINNLRKGGRNYAWGSAPGPREVSGGRSEGPRGSGEGCAAIVGMHGIANKAIYINKPNLRG